MTGAERRTKRLRACDSGDFIASPQEAAVAAPKLNFKQEVAFLTRTCIGSLSAKARGIPSLAKYGYVQESGSTFAKVGPKVKASVFAGGYSCSRVSVTYRPTVLNRTNNTCNIRVIGLVPDTGDKDILPLERAVAEASYETARRLGYQSVTVRSRTDGNTEKLVKGPHSISRFGHTRWASGVRSLILSFYAPG